MACSAASLGRLKGRVGRSAALLQAAAGSSPRYGRALQQARGKARGNEQQPSHIKCKYKHPWIPQARVQGILRRRHKGRKSLNQ